MGSIKYSDEQFTRPGQYVALTPSSEQENFLAVRTTEDDTRSKVWRTEGYYRVTSSNNGIRFEDTGGINTALIAEGEYQGDAAFFAAVKTALESAGGNTYNVIRDNVTKRIIVQSNAAFEFFMTNVNSTARQMLGFELQNFLAVSDPDPSWLARIVANNVSIHTEEFLIFDFGAPAKPQFFGLLPQSDQQLAISNAGEIKLEFNPSSNFSSPAQSIDLTYSAHGIYLVDKDGISDDFYRFMRVKIVDTENPKGFIEIAKVVAGSLLAIDKGGVQFPLTVGNNDFSSVTTSLSGQIYGVERASSRIASLRWFALDAANKERLEDHYRKHKTVKSFLVFLDPDEVFSTESTRSVLYCKYQSPPTLRLVNRGALWEVANQVVEQL